MSQHARKLDTANLVAGFLAQGGSIQKLPEALPATADDVVLYLKSRDVDVEIVPGETAKFNCQGAVVNLQGLFQIANRHRRKQRSPQFELPAAARR